MKNERLITEIVNAAWAELTRAIEKHGPMKSGHEGYAVILEELDELWLEVKTDGVEGKSAKAKKEAIQIAAMAMRYVHDVIGE